LFYRLQGLPGTGMVCINLESTLQACRRFFLVIRSRSQPEPGFGITVVLLYHLGQFLGPFFFITAANSVYAFLQ
jgi:hypothetical protein